MHIHSHAGRVRIYSRHSCCTTSCARSASSSFCRTAYCGSRMWFVGILLHTLLYQYGAVCRWDFIRSLLGLYSFLLLLRLEKNCPLLPKETVIMPLSIPAGISDDSRLIVFKIPNIPQLFPDWVATEELYHSHDVGACCMMEELVGTHRHCKQFGKPCGPKED